MHIRKLTGAVLLIAGTCIGAGMLALPITLGRTGFALSSLLLILCWLCTYLCGLYVLEANLCIEEDSNYISMSHKLLGRGGEIVAWVTYLLLLYSLMAAYLTGGGGIVRDFFAQYADVSVNAFISPLPWIIIVGVCIVLGTRFVDGFNRALIVGLLATYIMLIVSGAPETKVSYIQRSEFGYITAALPVLATAFGYHVIIPSLRTYMHGDVKRLSQTILLGSAIPLVIYLIWNFVVFGTIPFTGKNSLTWIYNMGGQPSDLTQTMATLLQSPSLVYIAELFIFFAIASSFLGISLSLFDFLADGLHIAKSKNGKSLIAMVTFLPPLLYALLYPKGFVLALGYAGVFVAVLHGILPALMVWSARRQQLSKVYQAPGGMVGVVMIFALSLLVIVSQLLVNFHFVHAY